MWGRRCSTWCSGEVCEGPHQSRGPRREGARTSMLQGVSCCCCCCSRVPEGRTSGDGGGRESGGEGSCSSGSPSLGTSIAGRQRGQRGRQRCPRRERDLLCLNVVACRSGCAASLTPPGRTESKERQGRREEARLWVPRGPRDGEAGTSQPTTVYSCRCSRLLTLFK